MGVVKSGTGKPSWGAIMEDTKCQDVPVFISSLGQHVFIGQLLCDNIILCPRHPAMDKTEVIPFLVKFSGKPTNENTSALPSTAQDPGKSIFLERKTKHQASIRMRVGGAQGVRTSLRALRQPWHVPSCNILASLHGYHLYKSQCLRHTRILLPASKLQNECGLHPTFTCVTQIGEVPPPRHGLKPIFTSTVGAVGAACMLRAWKTGSCREHKILSFICLFIYVRNIHWAPMMYQMLWSKECPLGTSSVGILSAPIPLLNSEAPSALSMSHLCHQHHFCLTVELLSLSGLT